MIINMKKVLLYSAFALGTLTMSTGCGDDFLLLSPVSSTSEATLSTPEGVDQLLTGAYSTLNSMLSSAGGMGEASLTNWVWGDIVGGDANKGSTASDQPDLTQLETWSWSKENGYIKNRWDAVYESVKRCNNVISLATKLADQLPNAADIIAQAQFLKGVWMFEGIRIYGPAIPYVSVEDYEASTDPQVSNVDESGNYVYIWDKVEADLKAAIAALPATRPSGEYGRATSWQAKAVLAKFYVYWSSPYDGSAGYGANKWSEAKSLLDEIIASGVDAMGQKYQLANDYQSLWHPDTSDWSGESIFDIQFTISGTTSQTNSPHHTHATEFSGSLGQGGWGFYQPSFEFVNSHIVDANGLPLSQAEYTAHAPLTPLASSNPVTDLSVYTDPRLDVNAGRMGVPYLDFGKTPDMSFVRDYTNGGMYVNKKGHAWNSERSSYPTTHPTSTAVNYHIIRFADILLWRAEIAINEGDLALALNYINQVRARAAKSYVAAESGITKGTYVFDNKVDGTTGVDAAANYRIGLYPSFSSAAEAREALEREMRIEFGMEGRRWFDIARWGKVADVLNAYAASESRYLGKFVNTYSPSWVNFPIPSSEINTAMGRFVQTANWK
ncbi:MAG: RagB/SusD family nutrient uptake outer membrane protein [Rikenellaceae bacterium]|nr:RagB/SusD family nutrient uptake outer membrane protein [Rikenellaceae bacterium]